MELENQILGFERQGDLPGDMIPYIYFDYLRTKQIWRVVQKRLNPPRSSAQQSGDLKVAGSA